MITVDYTSLLIISILVFSIAFSIGNSMWSNWIDYGDAFTSRDKRKK